jgi:hypothetical protein
MNEPRKRPRRSTALKQAAEATAGWEAERNRVQSLLKAALADFYQATAEAEAPLARAGDAVRRIRELLGGRLSDAAELCGISITTAQRLVASTGPRPEAVQGAEQEDEGHHDA